MELLTIEDALKRCGLPIRFLSEEVRAGGAGLCLSLVIFLFFYCNTLDGTGYQLITGIGVPGYCVPCLVPRSKWLTVPSTIKLC